MIRINPWYITGLIDAEGSFTVNVKKDTKRKSNYILIHTLEIGLNIKDRALIESIRYTLGVGNVYYKSKEKMYYWRVSSFGELHNVIIPHLTKYYLISQKRADFELFSKIINLIKDKKHFNQEGIEQIINLKSSMNKGLSEKLKIIFPEIHPVSRPDVKFKEIPDPNWLSGFMDGEGCFFISIYKSPKSKLGVAVQQVFKIAQHSRDIELLEGIVKYLNCGRVEKRKTEACDFTVTSFDSLYNIIIPFLRKYPLVGSKNLDFEDFSKVAELVKDKKHLTKDGIESIWNIKLKMNTKRHNI